MKRSGGAMEGHKKCLCGLRATKNSKLDSDHEQQTILSYTKDWGLHRDVRPHKYILNMFIAIIP